MRLRSLLPLLLVVPLLTVVPLALAQDDCGTGVMCMEVALGLPDTTMRLNAAPNVTQIQPDDSIIFDSNYRRILQAADIYDAPNGNVTSKLDPGFNFVTAGDDINGWTSINPGQYVKSEILGPALVSRFAGVTLPDTLAYRMGWMLVNAVPSRAPGTDPVDGDSAVLRYTKVNLFSSVIDPNGWTWYQIGPDQWVNQKAIARVLPVDRPTGVETDRWVSVDLYEQVLIAYEGTKPVFTTLISSGLKDWETNEGLFKVYDRYRRTVMSGAAGQPDFYYLQSVPYVQYFDNDIGLHGTYWHDGFGYRHSHGCVNLSIMDSKWLYDWGAPGADPVAPNDDGINVYVYSSGKY